MTFHLIIQTLILLSSAVIIYFGYRNNSHYLKFTGWISMAIIGFTLIITGLTMDAEKEHVPSSCEYTVEEIMVTGCEHVKDYMEENLGVPSNKKKFTYHILLVSEDNDSLVVESDMPVFIDPDNWVGQKVTVDTIRHYMRKTK